jgi:hypothetical protein
MKKIVLILTALLIAGVFVSEKSYASVVVPENATVIIPGNPDPATVKSAVKDFKKIKKSASKKLNRSSGITKQKKRMVIPEVITPFYLLFLLSCFRLWLFIFMKARSIIDFGSICS